MLAPILNKPKIEPRLKGSQVGLMKTPASIKSVNRTPGIEINTTFS